MQANSDPTGSELKKASPSYQTRTVDDGDHESMSLDDSLAMTPWERILANDDMINFGNSLRVAMEKQNAKPR
jgi:hypothetical protein